MKFRFPASFQHYSFNSSNIPTKLAAKNQIISELSTHMYIFMKNF